MNERAAQQGTLDGSIADSAPVAERTASATDHGGATFGRFLLGERRGQGSMGVVYAAHDLRDDRPVAVKVLPGSLLADLGRARRFAAEAELLASLDHPAIVRHVAHGLTPRGQPFLAMEWLDGEDLAHCLARRRLSVAEVVALGLRVAEGLSLAHERGIIHRDIKPSNLFLRGGDPAELVILDFGIARLEESAQALTVTGSVMGTPGYMAPEQARGAGAGGIDTRADLFSLGAVLFECLAGQPAFTGEHALAVLAKVLREDPPRLAALAPDLPPSLGALVARLLAKDPDERPTSAAEVALALAPLAAPRAPRAISAELPRAALDDRSLAGSADTVPAQAKSASSAPPSGERRQILAGRYEILGLLGVGGMGSVYRVRDLLLDEEVALKLLRPELLSTPGARDRFRQEVRLARKVTHRNVARTFDIGDHEGGLLLTMELLDGESLAERLEREGAMSVEAALAVAIELCAGLGAAHAASVIHRDLKPDNILLTRDGRVVITDFGIARAHADQRAARTAGILGTPAYMAPEQVEGAVEIDARADLYALGEILYEMLTGRRAWPSPSPIAAASARLISPPPDPRALNPRVPDELAAIIARLLARSRDDRFAEVSALPPLLSAVKLRPPGSHAAAEQAAPPRYGAASAPGVKTVAVLPLRNLGVPDYLADGILEDLVDTLSMTRGLRVRPGGVTLRYKDSPRDAREIGRELGVQVVVEASVRAAGADYRLTARVLSVDDGYQLWAQHFRRPSGEILEASDEAARAIAAALTADLDAPARGPAEGPRAAELYLRARAELRAAWHSSERIARVAELFDAAVEQSSHDPHILAGAALAHARVSYFRELTWPAQAEKALYQAERAISLAPQLAEPWIAIAMLRLDDGDGVGAARALHAALRAAPGSARAREMLGRLLLEAAEMEQAIALLSSALDLDPSNGEPRWDLVRAHALMGDMASAEALLALPVDTEAGRLMRAYVGARVALWQPRDRARAPRWEGPPGSGMVWRVVLLHEQVLRTRTLTDDDSAFLEKHAAGTRSRIGPIARQTLAELNLVIDSPRPERALALVRAAVDAGLSDIAWMDRCPVLTLLRADPAWAELRARVDERAARVRAAAREPERAGPSGAARG